MPAAKPALLVLLVAALLLVDFITLPAGLSVLQCRAALLIVFTVCSWAFGIFPEPLTTLVFFLLTILFHVAPPAVIFSGFATTTWWLVFGGTIIGIAIRTTNLGARISDLLSLKPSSSYKQYIALVVVASVGLAFLMPSTLGRVLLLTPIVIQLANRLGFQRGDAGYTGLILAVAFGSFMPSTAVLPANVPNTVLLGVADSVYGVKLQYGPYLLLHFPVLGFLKALVLIWMIPRLFPAVLAPLPAGASRQGNLSRHEKILIGILLVSLALYTTDAWHGISPAWISLASGLICLLPQTGLVSTKALNEQLQVTPLIYVAGFLGLGAMIAQTGLGALAGDRVLEFVHMTPANHLTNLAILALIGAGLGFITTLPGLPAVFTPLAKQFADASGLSLYAVLMLQVPIFSTVFLPYQCPPILIGMTLGGISIKEGTRLCMATAVITLVILLPLDLLWWRILGYV
jgi:di/tricarboxylate transporter